MNPVEQITEMLNNERISEIRVTCDSLSLAKSAYLRYNRARRHFSTPLKVTRKGKIVTISTFRNPNQITFVEK